jgi:hypothetical protein
MSTFGFVAAEQQPWVTMAITSNLTQLHSTALQREFSMLFGPLPDCDGCGAGVWARRRKGLDRNWPQNLDAALAKLPAGPGLAGIFVGDELMCGGIPYSNFSSVLRRIRAARPGALLYANECRWSCGLHDASCAVVEGWKAAGGGVPKELDLISFDEYTSGKYFTAGGGKCPVYFTDAAAEVQVAREFYETIVYPELHAHQRVLLVPPVYACSQFAIPPQDDYAAASLRAYASWGWNDAKVAGLISWHFNTRSKRQEGPPCRCDQRVGAAQMPRSLGMLRSLGRAIKQNNRSRSPARLGPALTTSGVDWEMSAEAANVWEAADGTLDVAKSDSRRGLKTDDKSPGWANTSAGRPFYRDPLWDGAHDPELVFHRTEGCYWLLYLQNRYNSPLANQARDGSTSTLTDFGLASTPDRGKSWIYRGVATGLDVPASVRSERLPPSGTQQYGGATWWRPAVTFANGTYHGFFVYWEAGHDESWDIIQYTSADLKHWNFSQVLRRRSFFYDSDVLKLGDGRFILLSTWWYAAKNHVNYSRPLPLQSRDLKRWEECTSPDFSAIDEGPHTSWNDASIRWRGYAWINWDGANGVHSSTGRRNMMRSSDGGMHWEASSNRSLFPQTHQTMCTPTGVDVGAAHQGPLILNQGEDGNEGWALYFGQFSVGEQYTRATGCGNTRAILQLGHVHTDAEGWLVVNRSEFPPPDFALRPPPGVSLPKNPVRTTHIAAAEAMVIVCAEIDRWFPGWFAPLALGAESTGTRMQLQQAQLPPTIKQNCNIMGGFYASVACDAAECVRWCEAEAQCAGFTWKHRNASGSTKTANCTGKAGEACGYMQNAMQVRGGWGVKQSYDCWLKSGHYGPPGPPKKPPPPPAPAPSCCCTVCKLPPECHNVGGAGVQPSCPSMMWRDTVVARRFFTSTRLRTTSESGAARWLWTLIFVTECATTGQVLDFVASVAGNGTILAIRSRNNSSHHRSNQTAVLAPLRQFQAPDCTT